MSKPFLLYFVNQIIKFFPPSRLYKLKRRLYIMAGISVGKNVNIVSSVNFWLSGKLIIGNNSFIGHDCLITGGDGKIVIGENVDIAPRTLIVSGTHEIDMLKPRTAGSGKSLPINIEDGAWIGAGAIVLGGVTIGKKSIVAAGSVVNKSIPPNVIAAGNPCRPIKKWDLEKKQWEKII